MALLFARVIFFVCNFAAQNKTSKGNLTKTSLIASLSTNLVSIEIRIWLENNRRYECVNIPSIPTLTIGQDL